jgi:hypothetical protein
MSKDPSHLTPYRLEVLGQIQDGNSPFTPGLGTYDRRQILWALDALFEKGLIEIGIRLTSKGVEALAPKPIGSSDRNVRRYGWYDPVTKTRIGGPGK